MHDPNSDLWKHPGLPPHMWARLSRTEGGCWLWSGAINSDGYGYVSILGKMHRIHRVAYEVFVGIIPEGKVLDHLCRVRNCANPNHLDATSVRTNALRGDTHPAHNYGKTECIHGHPFNEWNTLTDAKGRRNCRLCGRIKSARHKMKKQAQAAGLAA